jgi:hypothetical protein
VPVQPGFLGTLRGDVYQLGAEVGSGGEGIIRAVARRPELLAKLYRHPPQPHDVDKLHALVRAATPDLLTVTAWPTDCLKDRKGAVVGFVMPRVTDARPLYEPYSPRSRVQHFPYADFRFLLHATCNVARPFAAVEQAGFLMADVNHGNILVRGNGTLVAVDCDFFQVGDGLLYPCRVGTELFPPPELIGQNLGAVTRTPNHTAFGMAVLLFHLLFVGRHPFAGRFHGAGEMPIERAIAESRFAYARESKRTQMTQPPFTWPGPRRPSCSSAPSIPMGSAAGGRPRRHGSRRWTPPKARSPRAVQCPGISMRRASAAAPGTRSSAAAASSCSAVSCAPRQRRWAMSRPCGRAISPSPIPDLRNRSRARRIGARLRPCGASWRHVGLRQPLRVSAWLSPAGARPRARWQASHSSWS